jgi:hypothetical protein
MLPSPSKMRYHDPSRPVGNVRSFHDNRSQQPKRNLKDLPFIAPSSRLGIHQCANQSSTSTKPLTTLTLSLQLAQKIHQLILASQIENIARGIDSGMLSESQMATQMDSLDEQYNFLREDVECELETAWVNVGFLPASMPKFPAVVSKSANVPLVNDWSKDSYTVDKDLKRKREKIDKKSKKELKKRKRNIKQEVESDVSDVVEESWCAPVSVQPLGISRAMIPLGWPDRAKMATWTWLSNRSMENIRNVRDWDEGLMSPRGTVFVV